MTVEAGQSDESATVADGAGRPDTAGKGEVSGSAAMDPLMSRLDDMGVLTRGATIGRYVVTAILGRGAMGIVYAAYDPELDRKVAVKLLLPQGTAETRPEARIRLLREAQGLARLAHPNVVAVHDTGTVNGQVWLAMELVAGRTLRAWLSERRRGWREVLDVMHAAGEGLAAAHAAKLIHRDFKPDNVMVGDDGRVRVMDFGLVRTDTGPEDAPRDSAGPGALAVFAVELTAARVLGTPAYMPPEQWLGAGSDGRGDQFSFCVTLWEALYGERPFVGKTGKQVGLAIVSNQRKDPPAGVVVPPWLHRAVVRGLAKEPDERWPTMPDLLAELRHGARRGSRRWVAAAVLGTGVLAGGIFGVDATRASRARAACVAVGAEVAALPEERHAAVRAGLLATGSLFAETTADQALPLLASYATELGEAATQSCLRGLEDPKWASDRATACIAEARWSLDGLIDVLATADDVAVLRAVPAVIGLPRASRCLDATELARRPEVLGDPEARARADTLKAELARVEALALAGRYIEGLTAAKPLVGRADELGWAPLAVQARISLGLMALNSPEPATAEPPLEAALLLAERAGERSLALDAARSLGRAIGELGRYDEALRWDRAAEAMAAGSGETESARIVEIVHQIGVMQSEKSAYDEAQQTLERGLAMAGQIHGADHPVNVGLLTALSMVQLQRGDYAAAEALDQRALHLFAAVYGESHPLVAGLTTNLASARYMRGAYAEAQLLNERALAIWERTVGDRHPKFIGALVFAGHLAVVRGDSETARRQYARALALQEAMLGAEHPDLAGVLYSLGSVELACGRIPAAEAALDRALAMRVKALGEDNPDTLLPRLAVGELALHHGELAAADSAFNKARELGVRDAGADLVAIVDFRRGELARVRGDRAAARGHYAGALQALEGQLGADHQELADALVPLAEIDLADGKIDEADREFSRGLALVERALGGEHPGLAGALVGLGQIAVRRGDRIAARELLERAVALAGKDCAYYVELAEARFSLAQLLWADEGARDRARTLAREAAAGHAGSGAPWAARRAEIATWLAQRGRDG